MPKIAAIRNYLILAMGDTASLAAAPSSFLLLKYGTTEYTKGKDRGSYEFGPEDADKVLADWGTRGRDVVIDYEHQTLTGEEAPAAGWIERLEKTGEGIVAHLKAWTDKAKGYLASGEYRYFSPVLYTSRRRPFGLHSVALTNHPATHWPEALAFDDDETNNTERQNMDKLLKLLGLVALADDAANDAAIEARVAELLARETAAKAFLALHDAPDLDAVTGRIKGMVPAAELTALNDRLAGIEADKAVARAFADGKLVEAQREWALGYAKTSPQAFADFAAKAPKIAPEPAAAVKVADPAAPAVVALSDNEVAIFRRTGLTDEQIEAIRVERAAKPAAK